MAKTLEALVEAAIHAKAMIDHFIHGEESIDSLHSAHDRLAAALAAREEVLVLDAGHGKVLGEMMARIFGPSSKALTEREGVEIKALHAAQIALATPARPAAEGRVDWRLVGTEARPKPRKQADPDFIVDVVGRDGPRMGHPTPVEWEIVSMWEATIRATTSDGKPPARPSGGGEVG